MVGISAVAVDGFASAILYDRQHKMGQNLFSLTTGIAPLHVTAKFDTVFALERKRQCVPQKSDMT